MAEPVRVAAEAASVDPGLSLLGASREASNYFEHQFDKSFLNHAAAHKDLDWLLSEGAQCTDYPGGLIGKLFPPNDQGKYTFLLPKERDSGRDSEFNLQELHQVVRELVIGIYVFNQIPMLTMEPNYDCTSTCFMPSCYHDTLVGGKMVAVDYFIKSLLHGTTIAQRDKRIRLLEEWKKFSSLNLRNEFKENGLTSMQDDDELGKDVYEKKTTPFIRYPPKCVITEMTKSQLERHLTTGEDYERQMDHVSRDKFVQHLNSVSIGVVFGQERILQEGSIFVLSPSHEIVTSLLPLQQEADTSFQSLVQSYLQKQREFVHENIVKKSDIVQDMYMLEFVSFMIYLLVSLKKQNKTINVSKLQPPRPKETTKTDREVPPVFPTPQSHWSPYLSENNTAAMHGGIHFMKMPLRAETQVITEDEQAVIAMQLQIKKSTGSRASFASIHSRLSLDTDLVPVCKVGGKSYYVIQFEVEAYYPTTPKFPRWVHAMNTELKSQCARLPSVNDSKIQEMLRKFLGPRKAMEMKTVNVSLQASIKKGLIPAVVALLKRCTQTRLGKTDDSGMALIHYAAANGHPEVISALVLAGSDVDQPVCHPNQKPSKTLPVHFAARSGSVDALSCLECRGADVWVADDKGWTPLHHAAHQNYQVIIRYLLFLDPSMVNNKTTDDLCATPLLLAARNGCFDGVKCLVELGASLGEVTSSGFTIVHLAAMGYHISILKYLIVLDKEDLNVWALLSNMLKSPESAHEEAAARTLDPITQWKPEGSSELLKNGAVEEMVSLLKKDESLQLPAIQVLANLSNLDAVKTTLTQSEATVGYLVKLLASTRDRVQACTCLVLSDLAMQPDTQGSIAAAGAIPLLTKLLKSNVVDVQLFSCACIGILAYDSPSNQSLVLEAKAIPTLVTMLESPLSCVKVCAANTLRRVLEGNRQNQLSVLDENVIPLTVTLLRSNKPPMQKSGAKLIEFLAEDCKESQCEMLVNTVCILLLKRLLKMRNPTLKMCGSCALWAMAGALISNKRQIATHIGLEMLVDMLTIPNEKLVFVCSEALGSLATELGDNQNRIIDVGGVKPLVDVLTTPTSQRVSLSIINTLSALCVKPALVPNQKAQNAIAAAKGIIILASIVSDSQTADIVRVKAACMIAKVVLNNIENHHILVRYTNFSYVTIFKFLTSAEPMVRLLAGYCLSIMAFNNPARIVKMKAHGRLHFSNVNHFLQSEDEFSQAHAAFQVVVLSRLLAGIKSVDAIIRGTKVMVNLTSSNFEQTKVLSAEFTACMARMGNGIPDALVIAGILEPLMRNLGTSNGPVIESTSVALGYLTFSPMASRIILGMFRDNPELFTNFRDLFPLIVYSHKFLMVWQYTTKPGLPSLSLESRGGPCISTGRRQSAPAELYGAPRRNSHGQHMLGMTSTTTINTANTSTATEQQLQQDPPAQTTFLPQVSNRSVTAGISQPAQTNAHHSTPNRMPSVPLSKQQNVSVSFKPTSNSPLRLLSQRRAQLLSSVQYEHNWNKKGRATVSKCQKT